MLLDLTKGPSRQYEDVLLQCGLLDGHNTYGLLC